jgi:uncharacterized membrane protein (UPF0127 family)
MTKQNNNTTHTTLLFLGLALAAGLLVGFQLLQPLWVARTELVANPKTVQQELQVGASRLTVEVRDDDRERELGLSGREALGENEGMLFIFPQAERQLFWMKDMHFPIDVIWIVNGVVAEVMPRVSAPTREAPKIETMTSTMPVDMVLEVPAGWAEKQAIQVGDRVEFIQ